MNNKLTETGTRNLWLLAIGSAAIVFGLVYLAENVIQSDLDDLWALALLPVTLAFMAQARRVYVRAGRVSGTVAGWALIGLSTAVIALAFVFGPGFRCSVVRLLYNRRRGGRPRGLAMNLLTQPTLTADLIRFTAK